MLDQTTHKYNEATKLLEKGAWKKALPIFRDIVKQVESREALVNLGNCYRLQKDNVKAKECYSRAVATNICIDPMSELHALNNLGLAYYADGFDDKAIELYTKAIKKSPKFWEAWWNCSTAVLRKASTTGDMAIFKKGWEMYTARFLKNPPVKIQNTKDNLVYWSPGTHVESLVVLTEQGLGDSIMFGRYVKELERFANRVYVQCHPSLNDVFENTCNDASETDASVAYPICSLAGCFDYIPSGEWLKGKYGKREFPNDGRLNVGIVWAGSPTHTNDYYRSVNIHRFNRLACIANLYSLSPNFKSTKFVKSLDVKNWRDTAEAINGLDLVIGVDTSVIHMAGSLGAETWLLQPSYETDFRWGNGSSCCWYSSVRIFKNPGNWDVVFDNVEKALNEKCGRTLG